LQEYKNLGKTVHIAVVVVFCLAFELIAENPTALQVFLGSKRLCAVFWRLLLLVETGFGYWRSLA